MTIYVLHFSEPIEHARHYIGWTGKDDVQERLKSHMNGAGARIMRAVARRGIKVELALVIPGADLNFERQIKNRGGAGRWCPLCGLNTRGVPVWKGGK